MTNKNLSKLDISKTVHNPKLRHDIHFDLDLNFSPNVNGERLKKQKED